MEIIWGLILGSITGGVAVYIAYRQQLPKWREIGFALPKTPAEKEVILSRPKDFAGNKTKFSYLFPIVLTASTIATSISFFISRPVLNMDLRLLVAISCLWFVVVLVLGFRILATIFDKKIRTSKKSAQS